MTLSLESSSALESSDERNAKRVKTEKAGQTSFLDILVHYYCTNQHGCHRSCDSSRSGPIMGYKKSKDWLPSNDLWSPPKTVERSSLGAETDQSTLPTLSHLVLFAVGAKHFARMTIGRDFVCHRYSTRLAPGTRDPFPLFHYGWILAQGYKLSTWHFKTIDRACPHLPWCTVTVCHRQVQMLL